MHDIGQLYVLSNMDQSLAKVGLTRDGSPNARATDYERAHGIRWHVYWSATTLHVEEAEAAAHRELAPFRFSLVPGAREIYHLTPQKAVRVAERFVVPPSGAAQPSGAPAAWLAEGDALLAAISPALFRIAASSLRRHRYGRQLFAGWSVLSRLFHQLRTFR
jgi:hypothetical protein